MKKWLAQRHDLITLQTKGGWECHLWVNNFGLIYWSVVVIIIGFLLWIYK